MVIAVEPIVFTIGSWSVRWLGLVWLLAIGIGATIWVREVGRRGIGAATALDVLTWILPAGVVGARLFHLVATIDHYAAHPGDALSVTRGGYSLWGAIAGGGLCAYLLARTRGLDLVALADAAAPALAIAEAVGRLGCLLDGSNLGVPTELPWGVVYPNPRSQAPDHVLARHPAPLYHALAALAIWALVRRLSPRLPRGGPFALWLGLHAVARLGIGFVRADPPVLLGLQEAQWWSLVALAGLGSVMIWRLRRTSPGQAPIGP